MEHKELYIKENKGPFIKLRKREKIKRILENLQRANFKDTEGVKRRRQNTEAIRGTQGRRGQEDSEKLQHH